MNKYYQINAKGGGVEILLYGDIVQDEWGKWTEDDACPSEIVKALNDASGQDVTVRINSGGGSVFGGMAIYNVLKNYKGKKTVYVDGVAASIASVIVLAGDEIHIPENAYVMIHKPWGGVSGNAIDMQEYIDSLNVCEKGMMAAYNARLKDGVSSDEIDGIMQSGKDKWYTGAEIGALFDICVDSGVDAVACSSDCRAHYKNVPEKVTAKARDEPEKKNLYEDDISAAKAFLFTQNEKFGG